MKSKPYFPIISLTIIVLVMTLLLTLTYNLTYKDTSKEITKDLNSALEKVYGENDTFEILDNILTENKVAKIVKTSGGLLAFEVVVKGYNKDGIDVLVGFDDGGSVKNVAFISIAETPGIGTKVDDGGFLSQFGGKNDTLKITKKTPAENEINAITGATYSSKGVVIAVNTAISAYKEYIELGGVTVNE